MSALDLIERAKQLSQRLTSTDAARRQAELAEDLDLRDMLASATADLVREADPAVLRAIVLMWMLRRTRVDELLNNADQLVDPNLLDALKGAS
jgi:hypothetical protein